MHNLKKSLFLLRMFIIWESKWHNALHSPTTLFLSSFAFLHTNMMTSLPHAASSPSRTLSTEEQGLGTCLPTALPVVNPLPPGPRSHLPLLVQTSPFLWHMHVRLLPPVSLLCLHCQCTYMFLLGQWADSHLATCIASPAQAGPGPG